MKSATPKNPKTLKPLPGLSASARRNLDLPKTAPRKRLPGEALPTTICTASMPSSQPYRFGDGDRLPTLRPGADSANQLPSRGLGV